MAEIPKSVIDTLIAEAAGEGQEGMRRVAETILNRSAIRGLSPEQVVQQPYQYTGYSNPGPAAVQAQRDAQARAAAEAAWVLAQGTDDPTGGADHYYAQNTISRPSWARNMNNTGTYGGHTFYSSRPIPPMDIPNTVGTALSTVRTPTPVSPATMSPDLALMRNPIMSSSARRTQPYASDLAMSGRPNGVTPTLTPYGASSYAPTDFTPTTTARGLGSLTPDARPAPYPQTMSPQVAALRARDPNLQYELARRYPQVRLPELPPEGQPSYSQAMNQAARLAALRANQSQIERGQQLRPVGSSNQNIASQRAEQLGLRPVNSAARLPTGRPGQNYDVGINGPAALTRPQYAALGNQLSAPRPLAPTPLMASAGLQSRRNMPNSALAAMPAVAAAAPLMRPQMAYAPAPQQAAPLRVIVDGANYPNGISTGMTSVQSLQSQGYSPSQAYDLANKQARDQARERAGLSTSSGSDWWDRVTGS